MFARVRRNLLQNSDCYRVIKMLLEKAVMIQLGRGGQGPTFCSLCNKLSLHVEKKFLCEVADFECDK